MGARGRSPTCESKVRTPRLTAWTEVHAAARLVSIESKRFPVGRIERLGSVLPGPVEGLRPVVLRRPCRSG